tara:strand:- start:339 stop:674 length:336 start_codon:yes stop_codon:yes gene_type:complete
MTKKLFFIISFFLISQQSLLYAKINDKRIWQNLYDGCYAEYVPGSQITKKEMRIYCKCISNQITEQLTVKEVVLIESAITKAQSEDDKTRAMLANKKVEMIVADCISKIFN